MLSSMSQDNDKLGHFLKHNVKLFVPVLHLISFFFSLPIWDLGVRSYFKEERLLFLITEEERPLVDYLHV